MRRRTNTHASARLLVIMGPCTHRIFKNAVCLQKDFIGHLGTHKIYRIVAPCGCAARPRTQRDGCCIQNQSDTYRRYVRLNSCRDSSEFSSFFADVFESSTESFWHFHWSTSIIRFSYINMRSKKRNQHAAS